MEQALRQQLARGMNRLGGSVSHLRGLRHVEPNMRTCSGCAALVPVVFTIRPWCHSTAPGGGSTRSEAAVKIIRTTVTDQLAKEEPAITGRPQQTRGAYEERTKEALRQHICGRDIKVHLCHNCARDVARERYRAAVPLPQQQTDIEVDGSGHADIMRKRLFGVSLKSYSFGNLVMIRLLQQGFRDILRVR